MTRILFVEDDPNLGMLLKENLDGKGFELTWCRDGDQGKMAFTRNEYDLCILDVMMPVKDGFTLATEIRQQNSSIPIIFLTARSLYEDKIHGLEIGADDFITKPFSTRELLLRINAILRRTQRQPADKVARVGKYTFDQNRMTLQIDSDCTRLSSKEADLLGILIRHKDELVSRSVILKKVWGNDDYFSAKSMDVYISKIRKLLKKDPAIQVLNAYGTGFKLIVAGD